MDIPTIEQVADLKGKRVLLRASLNVPIVDGKVRSDFRLNRTLQTMNFLHEAGAVTLIIGHIGRDPHETLRPVYEHLSKLLPITFVERPEALPDRSADIVPGSLFMLENLRSFPGETENDPEFVELLASHAELYVSDAFSDAHREHASIVGIPARLPSYLGILLADEIKNLTGALAPEHPALFILGGAKFETKAPLIRKFLDTYDEVFVGGALAHDLFKAKGWNIGRSISSEEQLDVKDVLAHPHLLLPQDVMVETHDGSKLVKSSQEVGEDETILDAGPQTVADLLSRAADARFILWNGPLGNYERGYKEQTEMLARGLADAPADCVVGGGDTVASIASLNLIDTYAFVSTGGGAMLEFLQDGTLPGIEALKLFSKA